MKQNNLFKHKESIVTYQETMADAKKYQKLLEPLKKPKRAPNNTRIERMCDFCHKPKHLKELYH
jgi:hypothetical protein